jgi:predicted MFS family arabinose efflux permease
VPVLLAGALLPVAAAALCVPLPGRTGAAPEAPSATDGGRALPLAAVTGPWTAMVVSAAAAGGVITVLPLWTPGVGSSGGLAGGTATAAVALAVLTAGQLVGRGLAGELADRPRPRRHAPVVTLLGLGGVAAGAAVVAVGGAHVGALVHLGAALVGLGFGAVQSDTLLGLFARAGPARSGAASTWWNTAYDAGTGLGAAALSAVLGAAGAPAAFAVATLACLLAAPVSLALGRR